MSRALVIEPEAEREITEATDWYDQRSRSARVGFSQALERALAAIQNNPNQYQVVHRHVRRALLGRYPYALFYVATESEVIVMACFHCRRDPRRWQNWIS